MKRSLRAPVLALLAAAAAPLLSRGARADEAPAPSPSASASTSAAASASETSAVPIAVAAPAASSSAAPSASTESGDPTDAPPQRKRRANNADKGDDPLAIPEGVKSQIGETSLTAPAREGETRRNGFFPFVYSERTGNEVRGSYFPLFHQYRRLENDAGQTIDSESFYGLYYRRRSEKRDVDVAFPLVYHWRDENTRSWVIPPVYWSDGPNEWHRWVAPLFFAGSEADGGYFHAPLLLTSSHHSKKKAFSLIGGLGYYDRSERAIDWGVVPFVFGGNNGDKLTSYLLIPPLLTYHRQDDDNKTQTTVVGPVFSKSSPTSNVFDVLPLFFHNSGTRKEGGSYETNALLPFFWASHDEKSSFLFTPLYVHAKDPEGTTDVSWFYSRYRGRTSMDLAGPILPVFGHWVDPDLFKESWYVFPAYWSKSPTGSSLVTPLFGQWRESGVSRTTWIFPTFVDSVDKNGWSFNFHPFVYVGADATSSHTVVAPFYWDFINPHSRVTVGFPLYWRFRDDDGVTQIAANTIWLERKVGNGQTSKEFYFLPVVHVADAPNSSAWDVLFGLVGYKREGTHKQLQLFWTSIDLTPDPNAKKPKKGFD